MNEVTSQNIPYPVEVFPSKIRRFVQETASSIGVEDSLPASILLPVASAAIGRSARIKLKDDYAEIAPIWGAVIALSGSAKTPVFGALLTTLESIQAEADSRYSLEMKKYKSAKKRYAADYKKWKAEPYGTMPEEPEKPCRDQFLLNDASLCSIIEGLEQYQSGSLMYQDELAGLLNGIGPKELALLLSLFSGKSIRYTRNGKEDIIVPDPALALCGTIQPQVLKRIIRKNAQLDESGFLYRFLFCMPPAQAVTWSDASVSPETKVAFSETIRRIFDMRLVAPGSNGPMEFSLSPDAYKVWVAFRHANTAKENNAANDMIRAGLAKLPTHAARIALTLHVLECAEFDLPYAEWPLEVNAQTMANAVRLIEWHENELRKVIDMIRGRDTDVEGDMDLILNAIEQAESDLTLRDLQRESGRRFIRRGGAEELGELLQRMVELGHLSVRNEKAANGRVVGYFSFPDIVDVDTMDENTGENENSVNITPPEENSSPVDTMHENVGKNSVNVNLSTQERSIWAETPSADGEAKRSDIPSTATSEELRVNPVAMAVKTTYEKGGHGGVTADVFSLS